MRISSRIAALALAAALTGVACSTTPTVLPSRDFNRPTDVVFACVGAFDTGAGLAFSGRPMDWCQPFGMPAPAVDAEHHTYAFVPNSDSGELGVVDIDKGKLVDLDPSVSGYSRLPLGVLPEQIAASDDGCRLVTANRGSCDLTVVDPALLLAPTISPGMTGADGGQFPPGEIAKTVPPTTSSGQLMVAPQEVRFLPQDTSLLTGNANLCTDVQTYGAQPQPGDTPTPAPTTWKALVTFPSCDLIATIDLPSGMIIDSAFVRLAVDGSLSLSPAGADPHCPRADCGTVNRETVVPDGGTADSGDGAAAGSDGGGSPTSGPASPILGPSSIEISPPEAPGYGIHAFVSLANFPAIIPLDVSTAGLITSPATGASIPLHEIDPTAGSNRIRLSVNPYRRSPATTSVADPTMTLPGKVLGQFVDDANHPDRRYLYVIARDGTLRVVQVAKQPENECETNINPQHPPAGYDPQAACIPVTTSSPENRRPFAVGPGIRFGSVPIDVAVADTTFPNPELTDPTDPPTFTNTVRELSLSGVFAWVATSSGSVFLLNIDPVARSTWYIPEGAGSTATLGTTTCTADNGATPCEAETLPPVNTLRDGNVITFSRGLSPGSGPPRLDLSPLVPISGPRIATLWTQGTHNNATAIIGGTNIPTYAYFPDRAAVNPQTWAASWQGPLFGGPRFTGHVSPAASTLDDIGFGFCQIGAQVGDLVTFTGCVDNNQCGVGQACIHGPGTTQAAGGLTVEGICVEQNSSLHPNSEGELAETCGNELSTIRRYAVTNLTNHVLTLEPHLDELAFSNLHACADRRTSVAGTDAGVTDGGTTDGGTADGGTIGGQDCSDPSDSTTAPFRCTDLTSSGVTGVTGTRCVQACATPLSTTGCRAGRICVPFGGFQDCGHNNCFCADAPPLGNLMCGYEQLTPYQVSAGRAFVVNGSATPMPTARAVGNDDQCGAAISQDPRSVSRISMDAGPMMTCVDTDGTFAALATADTRCTATDDLNGPKCTGAKNLFKALQTMPSPNPCLFKTGPNDSDPPTAFSSTHVNALFRNTEVAFIVTNLEWAPSIPQDLRFDVHGGLRPDTVVIPPTVELSMPGRIVVGPIFTTTPNAVPYLFVIDQRALGRSQAGGPTRGQLLRIHPLGLANTNGSYQAWFEDFTHSNNEYPIR